MTDELDYDPATAPDPTAWLALDEGERFQRAIRAHAGRFPDALHHADGNPMMHGPLHAIVENQIALGEPTIVGQTLQRLQDAGLQRHPALHAIMRELVVQLKGLGGEGQAFDTAAYAQALAAIQPADVVAAALTNPTIRPGAPGEPQADPPGAPRNRAERRAAKKKRKTKRPR